MNDKYIKYPTTVKTLIQELIRICDDYIARKTNEDELRYFIQYWANNAGEMMFAPGNEFNPTLKQRVGTKRLKLVSKMMEGIQLKI